MSEPNPSTTVYGVPSFQSHSIPFDMSDNELMDAFSDMTESILNSLFPQLGSMNMNLGNYTIDACGNDIIIQSGIVRR